MTRLIDAGMAIEVADAIWTVTGDINVAKVWQQIKDLPTVDAVPISFIEKRIEQLKSHADYEFEANGGYAGGSQYRQWELECLLDAWAKEIRDDQTD